jgi:hypothetical protein
MDLREESKFGSQHEQEIFSLFHNVQTNSGVHPAPYPMGTCDYSLGESGQGVKVTTHLPINARIVLQIRLDPLPSNSLFTNHPIISCYIL